MTPKSTRRQEGKIWARRRHRISYGRPAPACTPLYFVFLPQNRGGRGTHLAALIGQSTLRVKTALPISCTVLSPVNYSMQHSPRVPYSINPSTIRSVPAHQQHLQPIPSLLVQSRAHFRIGSPRPGRRARTLLFWDSDKTSKHKEGRVSYLFFCSVFLSHPFLP